MEYAEIIKFHGHECPGLAMGYRMATAGLKSIKSLHASDEEIVSIVENDACGVDALQCLTGCTFGKGNLIFHDYGKHVYTIYSRATKKGVRVVFNPEAVLLNQPIAIAKFFHQMHTGHNHCKIKTMMLRNGFEYAS